MHGSTPAWQGPPANREPGCPPPARNSIPHSIGACQGPGSRCRSSALCESPTTARIILSRRGWGVFPSSMSMITRGVPESWKKRGGVMMPMHRTEALWLRFSADYPMALKVAAGGICAVSGGRWSATLQDSPQNYVVLPEKPWLDGFRVSSVVEAGLGAGGRMRQEITADPYGLDAWDTSLTSRCYIHLCLADDWERLTGTPPLRSAPRPCGNGLPVASSRWRTSSLPPLTWCRTTPSRSRRAGRTGGPPTRCRRGRV